MIYNQLYQWQKDLVKNNCDKHAYGLFLGCGLGKTPISLAFAEAHDCNRILIITINSKVTETISTSGSWEQWISNLDEPYIVSKKKVYTIGKRTAFIINYEALFSREKNRKAKVMLNESIVNFLDSCKGEKVAVIIDESHKMKDSSSMQTLAIYEIQRRLKVIARESFFYLLTGTPYTKGFIDLYTQLKFLGWDKTKTYFKDTFCELGHIRGLLGWQQPIVGYKNVDELINIVHRYAVTIDSDDVLNLPEQTFDYHTLPLSKHIEMFMKKTCSIKQLQDYMKARGMNTTTPYLSTNNPFYRDIGWDGKTGKWIAQTSAQMWLRARQLSIGFNGNADEYVWVDDSRLKELERLLEQNPDNYVIFYNYTPELYRLFDICKELEYNVDIYCGDIKALNNYEIYERQTEAERLTNKKNVIIANFASGSTGKNWQLYNQCIIFSLPLYKDWVQGLARIHRNGQTKPTVYHVFTQNNWLDKSMMKAIEEKQDYTEKMFEADLKEYV